MHSAHVIIHCEPAETYYVIRNLKYTPEIKEAGRGYRTCPVEVHLNLIKP